jgi:hypothetical protein
VKIQPQLVVTPGKQTNIPTEGKPALTKKKTSFVLYFCRSANPDHDEQSPDIVLLWAVQLV